MTAPANTPMQLNIIGQSKRDAFFVVIHDAAKPRVNVSDWQPVAYAGCCLVRVRWPRPSIRQSVVLGNLQVQTKKMVGAEMLRSFHWARSARVVTLEQRSFPTQYRTGQHGIRIYRR